MEGLMDTKIKQGGKLFLIGWTVLLLVLGFAVHKGFAKTPESRPRGPRFYKEPLTLSPIWRRRPKNPWSISVRLRLSKEEVDFDLLLARIAHIMTSLNGILETRFLETSGRTASDPVLLLIRMASY
jgi:hypothetical protein